MNTDCGGAEKRGTEGNGYPGGGFGEGALSSRRIASILDESALRSTEREDHANKAERLAAVHEHGPGARRRTNIPAPASALAKLRVDASQSNLAIRIHVDETRWSINDPSTLLAIRHDFDDTQCYN